MSTLAVAGAIGTGFALGGFNAVTQNDGNQLSAAPDWVAPSVDATAIAKTTGYSPDFLKQGGGYYIYANVSDSGNPASGTATVRADVSSIDTGQTSVNLSAGSFSVGGLSYNRRSAALTANTPLLAGSYTYSITSTDSDSNAGTETGFPVTVDNTAPTAAGIETANGSTIVGRPQQNDTVTYTYSEEIDPASILSSWTGAQTDVVVRINNNTVSNNDAVLVYNSSNTSQLPLGSINLGRADYVGANRTFGASGTKSKMTLSGNQITIVLGTQSGNGTTAASNGTMVWTPSITAYDRAGNNALPASATESGTADREF